MEIKKALVVGAGTMGAGIAQLVAQNNIIAVLEIGRASCRGRV